MFDMVPFGRRNHDMLDLFDDFDREFFGGFPQYTFKQNYMRTDVLDRGDHYELSAELPGFTKEDIHMDLNDNTLVIHAEHKDKKEEKKEDFVKRERFYGSFSRSFDVTGVDTDHIDASYHEGILTVNLPKKELPPKQGRSIDIR